MGRTCSVRFYKSEEQGSENAERTRRMPHQCSLPTWPHVEITVLNLPAQIPTGRCFLHQRQKGTLLHLHQVDTHDPDLQGIQQQDNSASAVAQ